MAFDRTNMISLLNVGKLMSGATTKLMEMGDGYSELSEDWGPEIKDSHYVNMKSKASTVSGYALSITAEREYMGDEMQEELDKLFKKFPTGKDCETEYCRFFKTDTVEGKEDVFSAIKVPVIVVPSSVGGEGGGTLVSSIQVNGNGDVKEGYVTMSKDGEFTWSDSKPT